MLKVGDKVVVVKRLPEDMDTHAEVGTIGEIVEVDEEWMYPYTVSFDQENLYDDEMLALFREDVVAEAGVEIRKFHVIHKAIYHENEIYHDLVVTHYQTTLLDEKDQIICSHLTMDEPRNNPTLSGFFKALDYLGEKYEVMVEYCDF